MPTVHHRTVTVDGLDVFYRESGPEHAPVLVLLHGYHPTSSHMWRLALAEPGALEGVISQNGNAYEEGFAPAFWDPIWAYAADRSESNEAALRPALGREAVEWQYTHGVPDVTTIDPDAWEHDLALLHRPEIDRAQLDLYADYVTNRRLYPAVHEWLGASQIPVLAVWGRNDAIFSAAGAEAFRRDVDGARVELLDGGHFLFESHLDQVVHIVREWQTQQQTVSTS